MSAAAVAAALGGPTLLHTEVRSELDLAFAARTGIAAESAWRVVQDGLLDADELYALVVPRRTFDRRRDDKAALTLDEADRLLRVIRVVVRAREALGDEGKAHLWLRTPNRALRGERPLGLLTTDVGARTVERVLGRIEHGVAS